MNSEGEDTNLLVFRICESQLSHLVISFTRRTLKKGSGTVTSAKWHSIQKAKVSCKTDWMRNDRENTVFI
jgi:hypothetical protein